MKRALVILGLLVACGGADTGGPSPDDQAAALCDLYRAACERQVECGVYLYTSATSVESCLAALDCEGVVESALDGGVEVSIPNATSCQQAIEAATCDELQPWRDGSPTSYLTSRDDCAGVLTGTRGVGEACARSEQCVEGTTCEGMTCPGTCVETTPRCDPFGCGPDRYCGAFGECIARGELGAPCGISNSENTCVDGTACEIPFGQIEGTCVPQRARDQACVDSGLYVCQAGSVCRDGACQAPLAPGAPCSGSQECGLDGFCDFEIGQCAATRPLGAACGNSFGECGLAASCLEGTCQVPGDPASGPIEIRPTVGAGESCAMANCARGLACRPSGDPLDPTWTCAPEIALGASCRGPSSDFDPALWSQRGVEACSEGVCDFFGSFTCVTPKQPGEACATPGLTAECASLLCIEGRCAPLFECPEL